ncbi:MAG: hypothetical protein M1828_005895 [Chrysothrix sp. TS-e1954]|nr:MAG: hypothetical protein M1828_005895 [Chrysothrix sp. TS-e1954]
MADDSMRSRVDGADYVARVAHVIQEFPNVEVEDSVVESSNLAPIRDIRLLGIKGGLEAAHTVFSQPKGRVHSVLEILRAIELACYDASWLYKQLCDREADLIPEFEHERWCVRDNFQSAANWALTESKRAFGMSSPTCVLQHRPETLLPDNTLSSRLVAFNYSVLQPLIDMMEGKSNSETLTAITRRLKITIGLMFDHNLRVIEEEQPFRMRDTQPGYGLPLPSQLFRTELRRQNDYQRASTQYGEGLAQQINGSNIELAVSPASIQTPNFSDFTARSTPQGFHLHVGRGARIASEVLGERPPSRFREEHPPSSQVAQPSYAYRPRAKPYVEWTAIRLKQLENLVQQPNGL